MSDVQREDVTHRYIARRLVQIGLEADMPSPGIRVGHAEPDAVAVKDTLIWTGLGLWRLLRFFHADGRCAAWGAKFYPAVSGRQLHPNEGDQ